MQETGFELSPQQEISDRIATISRQTPREYERCLIELGYRGQQHARQAASVLAYRHVQRLRRVHLDKLAPDQLGPRENYLFIGPTGCGKTFLVELLCKQVLHLPFVSADITQYSETGYVGDDVNMLLSRLFEEAGQDLAWAACGILCIDEFDKLAGSRSNTRFAGAGTSKDVSGFGVQRSLLSLLSADSLNFPADFGFAHLGPKLSMPLGCVGIIACGAFSGLKTVADLLERTEHIGFGRSSQAHMHEEIAVRFDDRILEQTTAFAHYGFLPELVGRFSRVVAFHPLDDDTLRQILHDNVLVAYQREFAQEGFALQIEDAVYEHVIAQAKRRELGARGLRAALVPYLEQAAFAHFGDKQGGSLRLCMEKEQMTIQVR